MLDRKMLLRRMRRRGQPPVPRRGQWLWRKIRPSRSLLPRKIYQNEEQAKTTGICHFGKRRGKLEKNWRNYLNGWCTVIMSMFVSSKWQREALPMRWHASVHAIFYCYHTFLDNRTNVSRKVRAPRRVSALGAPNNVQNCHLDKTNMDETNLY